MDRSRGAARLRAAGVLLAWFVGPSLAQEAPVEEPAQPPQGAEAAKQAPPDIVELGEIVEVAEPAAAQLKALADAPIEGGIWAAVEKATVPPSDVAPAEAVPPGDEPVKEEAVGERREEPGSEAGAPPEAPGAPLGAEEPSPPDDVSFLDVVGVGGDERFHCSGVLIAPALVLTAAHCVPASRVAFGAKLAAPAVVRDVKETIVHPRLDAALLRLSRPIAAPIRSRRTYRDAKAPQGVLRIVGFGVATPRTMAGFGIKRRVDLAVTSWGCDASRARTAGCWPGAEMVVTAQAGRDTCFGDSGGPALERVGDELRLLAITSRAVARGGARCGRGGVYVRLDVLDPWLRQQGAAR